jgi:hypothetical protein
MPESRRQSSLLSRRALNFRLSILASLLKALCDLRADQRVATLTVRAAELAALDDRWRSFDC